MKTKINTFTMYLLLSIGILDAQSIKVGSKVDIPAVDGKIYKGTIKEIIHTAHKVEYDGFDGQYAWLTIDQFKVSDPISENINKISPLAGINQNKGWKTGSRVEAFSAKKWYTGSIVEIKDSRYKIRYDGYAETWDTWVAEHELRLPGSNNDAKVSLDQAAKGKLYLRHIRWLTSGNTSLNWYFLADNGTIVVDPIHGVNPVNLYAERMDNMKNIGTYTLTKNLLKVKWVNGTTSEVEVEYENGEIIRIDAMSIVMRQYGVPAGFRLNGTYSGVLSAGGVSSGRTFTFSKGGSFSIQNTGYVSNGVTNAVSTNSNAGKYVISGNTLTLNYDDGKLEKSIIAIWDNRLVINGTSLPMTGN
jgi:hypothetical protein